MPPPSANDPLIPAPGLVARYRADLARLIDAERDRVLVALSGGADSVALLLLTRAVLGERCLAATVDHRLRPAAAAEARTAAELCARRGVPHAVLTGELPARAGRTANVSARARSLRYRLLHDHAAASGADWLLTAHHADDQLETTLMRLNRGAGVAGLAGIRPAGWRIARPLLRWRRAELAAIVAAAGIEPADDPTNRDDRFDRARVRKRLADADWLDTDRLAASAAALAQADEALVWTTQHLLAERAIEDGDAIRFEPAGLPAELVRRLVCACITRIDPVATPAGPALGRVIASLTDGRPASIGAVLATPGAQWRFALAPPRRTP